MDGGGKKRNLIAVMLLISFLPAGGLFLLIFMMGGGIVACLAVFLAMLLQAGVSVAVFYRLLSGKRAESPGVDISGCDPGGNGLRNLPGSGTPLSPEFVLHRAPGAGERLQQVMPAAPRHAGNPREEAAAGEGGRGRGEGSPREEAAAGERSRGRGEGALREEAADGEGGRGRGEGASRDTEALAEDERNHREEGDPAGAAAAGGRGDGTSGGRMEAEAPAFWDYDLPARDGDDFDI